MQGETPYIEPNLLLASSFEKLIEDYKKYGRYVFSFLQDDKSVSPKDLLDYRTVFVVAEPGQGKSRLLNELYKQVDNKQSALVDLKLRGRDETIEDYIKSQTDSWDTTQPAVVLLDGLDEVAGSDILPAIRHIKQYIKENSNHKVFVASRLHYFTKFEPQFNDLKDSRFVLVEPLKLSQSRKFLMSLGIAEERVKLIIGSLNNFNREDPLVIQNPRYLEFLGFYLRSHPDVTENINRAVIFDTFVDNALLAEDKDGKSLKAIKRKFLERLALTMEIGRVNVITERDFITFIDTATSDAKLALLSQVSVDELYTHSLLKKDGNDIGFENAEIQEYLAANAIAEHGDGPHVVFDIAIEPNLRELFPAWINTMSFLVDEKPELLTDLANLKDNPDAVAIDESWHRLLTGATSSSLTDEYRKSIYERVISYYFDSNQWIDDDIAFNLANYSLPEHVKEIIGLVTSEASSEGETIRLRNAVRICGHIASLKKLSDDQKKIVRDRLVKIALDDKDTGASYEAISALKGVADPTVLKELLPLANSSDSQILNALQYLAMDLDLNGEAANTIFAEGVKNSASRYGRQGLLSVDSKDGLTFSIKAIANDQALLSTLIGHDSLFKDEEEGFVAKLSKQWQSEWIPTLKQIVFNSFNEDAGYYAARSVFVQQTISLIGSNDPTYFGELVDITMDKKRLIVDDLSETIAEIMRLEDVEVLAEVINKEDDHIKWFPFRILRSLPHTQNKNKDAIEKKARELLQDMYKAAEDAEKKAAKQKSRRDGIVLEIEQRIKNAKAESFNDVVKVVQIIDNDRDGDLLKTIDEDDLKFLWEKLKEVILDKFDPLDANLEITNRKAGNTSYKINSYAPVFLLAVKFAYKTKREDVQKYRTKLIQMIPYSYSDDMEAILNFVGSMTPEEEQLIVDAYKDEKSAQAQFMPNNLLEVAEKYKLTKTAPILDRLIDEENDHIWNRKKALEVSQALEPNPQRLQEIFEKYKDDEKTKELALNANALLISKYDDEKALIWRIEYLKHGAFEHVDQTEGHYVSDLESELHDGHVTGPVGSVKDPKYIDTYLELLAKGLELVVKGPTWQNYAYYLWKPVDQYFTNLIIDGDFKPLEKLEKYVGDYSDKVASARYIRHLNAIKSEYLRALGKNDTFADAINKHNQLSQKAYLKINSERSLFETIHDIIDKDWRKWVQDEGRKFVREVPEQRHLAIELENLLLRKDFFPDGVRRNPHLLRESQALDGTKTDFLVYYGFYGPVVIELKRSEHGDLNATVLEDQESYKSLEAYMTKFHAENGILLVYADKNYTDDEWTAFLDKVKQAYEKIPGIRVIGVRVIIEEPESKEKSS